MDVTAVNMTIDSLKKNNIKAELVKTGEEAKNRIIDLLPDGSLIGIGGSTSVVQIGLLAALRSGDFFLIDQYEEGITREESFERRRRGLLADYFITGTNAITMDGVLINMDGFGNRVAAQIWGPKKVIIVSSINKIVKDVDEGIDRIRKIAAPLNARRLNIDTPCVRKEPCEKCLPDKTICNFLTIINRQPIPERMHIFLIEEKVGF